MPRRQTAISTGYHVAAKILSWLKPDR
jgi:hypothetical protein